MLSCFFALLLLSRTFLVVKSSENFYSLVEEFSEEAEEKEDELENMFREIGLNDREVNYERSSRDYVNERKTLPSFVEDKMTKSELLEHFKEILKFYFNPMAITIYLCDLESDEFLNIAMILNGMLRLKRHDVFQELASLWGYFIVLQKNPDGEAFNYILQLITKNKYTEIIDGLLDSCSSLNILSSSSKKSIIIHSYDNMKLKLSSLKYLYEVSWELIEKKFKKDQLVDLPINFKMDVMIFDDLIS